MTYRERIEYLMNTYMLTPSQFSEKTGIQRASVSHILSNRNKPSLEIMLKIYNTFPDVDLQWLITGEGLPPQIQNKTENKEDDGEGFTDENSLFEKNADSKVCENKKTEEQVLNLTDNINMVTDSNLLDCPDVNNTSVSVNDVLHNVNGISVSSGIDSRKIKEIKIFYSNGTYETFLPEKQLHQDL